MSVASTISAIRNTRRLNQASPVPAASLVPELTSAYILVIHRPTGRYYYLDRSYQLLPLERVTMLADPFLDNASVVRNAVDYQDGWDGCEGHQQASKPVWAAGVPVSEFTAHWLY